MDDRKPTSFLRVYQRHDPDRVERYSQIGYAMHLLSHSVRGRQRSAAYVTSLLLPAIDHRQVAFLFDEDGSPAAFVIWARLALDVEKRLMAASGLDLHLSEWNEGSSLWLLDLVAPFGNLKYVLQYLRDTLFVKESKVRYMRQARRSVRVLEISRAELSGCLRSMPPAPLLCRCGRKNCLMDPTADSQTCCDVGDR
jgi:hemolysin-activating ACP:hemolysin acyltransferase